MAEYKGNGYAEKSCVSWCYGTNEGSMNDGWSTSRGMEEGGHQEE